MLIVCDTSPPSLSASTAIAIQNAMIRQNSNVEIPTQHETNTKHPTNQEGKPCWAMIRCLGTFRVQPFSQGFLASGELFP
ncbi:hypothetical protein HYFRA_00014011 [Hymenoscyphus fraxineus]|uniref:Uncharacterized protein n=1 Tax=Hymenoscyphus fraxineus TaxID=746836 RepID=A0A9N9PZV9_9HELO|nr:hypothetical protein HYFRA_00014011 [Hymenoscyphus fraxineus]